MTAPPPSHTHTCNGMTPRCWLFRIVLGIKGRGVKSFHFQIVGDVSWVGDFFGKEKRTDCPRWPPKCLTMNLQLYLFNYVNTVRNSCAVPLCVCHIYFIRSHFMVLLLILTKTKQKIKIEWLKPIHCCLLHAIFVIDFVVCQ